MMQIVSPITEHNKENESILASKPNPKNQQTAKEKAKIIADLKGDIIKNAKSTEVTESKSKQTKESSIKYPKSMDADEPLLIESKNRFVLFPIADKEVTHCIFLFAFMNHSKL